MSENEDKKEIDISYGMFRGKQLKGMTKEELIVAVDFLGSQLQVQKDTIRTLEKDVAGLEEEVNYGNGRYCRAGVFVV